MEALATAAPCPYTHAFSLAPRLARADLARADAKLQLPV